MLTQYSKLWVVKFNESGVVLLGPLNVQCGKVLQPDLYCRYYEVCHYFPMYWVWQASVQNLVYICWNVYFTTVANIETPLTCHMQYVQQLSKMTSQPLKCPQSNSSQMSWIEQKEHNFIFITLICTYCTHANIGTIFQGVAIFFSISILRVCLKWDKQF